MRFAGDIAAAPGLASRRRSADGEARLGTSGRLLIRESGTEPLIRVMAEGEDEALVGALVDELCAMIAEAAAEAGARRQ